MLALIKHQPVLSQNLLGSSEDWVSDGLPGWCNNYLKTKSRKSLQPDIVFCPG